jgi:hypothetical protein
LQRDESCRPFCWKQVIHGAQMLSKLDEDASILLQHFQCPLRASLVAGFEQSRAHFRVVDLLALVERCAIAGFKSLARYSKLKINASNVLINANSQGNAYPARPLGSLIPRRHAVRHCCETRERGDPSRRRYQDDAAPTSGFGARTERRRVCSIVATEPGLGKLGNWVATLRTRPARPKPVKDSNGRREGCASHYLSLAAHRQMVRRG